MLYTHRGVWGVVKHIQFEESNIYAYNHIFPFSQGPFLRGRELFI